MLDDPFHSVLFLHESDASGSGPTDPPAVFGDLNLDQLVDSVTIGRETYDLAPFFYRALTNVDAITYRHEVMRDLQAPAVMACIETFANKMKSMREQLEQMTKLHHPLQREAWFADAVETYANAVGALSAELDQQVLASRGLRGLLEYLRSYTSGDGFTRLLAQTHQVKEHLSTIRYCVHINGSRVTVSRYEDELDLSTEVMSTFAKFKQKEAKDYRVGFRSWAEMDHVESQILDRVASLHPDVFTELEDYCRTWRDFVEPTIATFDREIQFYLAFLAYSSRIEDAGLDFCYPDLSPDSKQEHADAVFDIVLASKLVRENAPVVCNDFHLNDQERIFVVSGPNQGGKSTFARTFGQLHFLAALGCPVPGTRARLFLFDQLFTHFERQEDVTNLRGKLEDELIRIHDILGQATPNSIIILNEIFTSTTLRDALTLGRQVMERLTDLDVLCVYVTFVDELAAFSDAIVSMVSEIVPDDPATRTYKVSRHPADGLAYAAVLADRYGLSYQQLKERVTS